MRIWRWLVPACLVTACSATTDPRCGAIASIVIAPSDTVLVVPDRLALLPMIVGAADGCGRPIHNPAVTVVAVAQEPAQMRMIAPDTIWSLTAQTVVLTFVATADARIMAMGQAHWVVTPLQTAGRGRP